MFSAPSLRRLSLALLGATTALTLTSCADDAGAAAASVVVENAWVRATTGAQDASMTGAFMTLRNPGSSEARLVRAASPVAARAELHVMAMDGGTKHMHRVRTGFRVPAGDAAVLEPGGRHVMLMGLTAPLAAGDEVTLVLTFAGGVTKTVVAPVKAFAEEKGGYAGTPSPAPAMSMG